MADELQQLSEQLIKLQQQCWELTLSAINTPTPGTACSTDDSDARPDPLKQLLQAAHLQFLNNMDKQGARNATDKLSEHFETAVNPALQALFLQQWKIPPETLRTADNCDDDANAKKSSGLFQSLLADSHRLTALGTRFNTALANYLGHFELISRDTLNRFEQQSSRTEETPDLFSAESLWTECYEASYQQQVFTPEYQRDYGVLCNCASELKLHLRRLIEPHLAELGMISLDSFRQSLQRQQQQKKAIRQLKLQLRTVDSNIEQLSQQYDQRLVQMEKDNAELKAELQQLRHLLMSRGTQ